MTRWIYEMIQSRKSRFASDGGSAIPLSAPGRKDDENVEFTKVVIHHEIQKIPKALIFPVSPPLPGNRRSP
jgi:hypothetical protein